MHVLLRLHTRSWLAHRLSTIELRAIRITARGKGGTGLAGGSGAALTAAAAASASAAVAPRRAPSRSTATAAEVASTASRCALNRRALRYGSSSGCCRVVRASATAVKMADTPTAGVAVPNPDMDLDVAQNGAGVVPKAYVRAPPGGDSLVVTVSLGGKTCNLNRPTDEPLDKALTRLAKNLTAKPSKKEKRKKPAPPSAGAFGDDGCGAAPGGGGADSSVDEAGAGAGAVLFEDEGATRSLDRSLPNGAAWLRGALLLVAGERFEVVVNPPTVDKLAIDRLAMVGYPTAAAVSLSYANVSTCRWRWSAQRPGGGGGEWVDLACRTQFYTPTAADEGCVLRVECTPGARRRRRGALGGGGGDDSREVAAVRDGEPEAEAEEELWFGETVSGMTGPVQHGPATCSATLRCVHTPTPVQSPGFRILSYNILADQYAGSDYAQNVLFNYCPKECLDPGYRRPLVLRELLGYRADVVCLQEVDERAFTDFLTLHLGLQGYSGYYTSKQGRVREGSATFWRTARFTALAHADIRLREAFAEPLPPLHAQFAPLLAASRELTRALQQVTTIAQATLLVPTPAGRDDAGRKGDGGGGGGDDDGGGGGSLCVVTTHLFFHPYAPHIRTMHTAAILEETAAFLERCAADPALAGALSGRRPTVLFAGDLNSDLNDGIPGVIELLRRGKLPADYWDWVQGAAFKWGMGEEDAEAMAQGTAQIAAAATAAQTPAASVAAPSDGAGIDAAPAAAASAASLTSQFDSAAAAPHHPIPVTGIDITAPFVLRSADDLTTPYTNYTSGYKALLDYVWYEESALRVVRSVPIPSESELGSFIPSPAFPSDHLAVVYDMEWREQEEQQQQQEGGGQ